MSGGVFDCDGGVDCLFFAGVHIHAMFLYKKPLTSGTDVILGQALEFFPVALEVQCVIHFAIGNVLNPRWSF